MQLEKHLKRRIGMSFILVDIRKETELYILRYKIHNSLVINVRGTFKVPRT